ncbi:MAG TPA: hypothetical protein VN841_16130 [Bryobacteraceae bacterium]|nr:hypothetical protein [Bryobacteraceae bacterium]
MLLIEGRVAQCSGKQAEMPEMFPAFVATDLHLIPSKTMSGSPAKSPIGPQGG